VNIKIINIIKYIGIVKNPKLIKLIPFANRLTSKHTKNMAIVQNKAVNAFVPEFTS
jgi:hypothetical protein